MSKIAFIPARSGSKGIPGKNTKHLVGKPLVIYTLDAAMKSHCDYVVISTDCDRIFNICSEHVYTFYSNQINKLIYHRRPGVLAGDTSLIKDAFFDFYSQFNHLNISEFVILQPTSPLRTTEDIDNAINLIADKMHTSVISVCHATQHPMEMLTIKNNKVEFMVQHDSSHQRQQYPTAYFINGAIYAYTVSQYIKDPKSVYSDSYLLLMESNDSVDIDTADDWAYAEHLIKQKNQSFAL